MKFSPLTDWLASLGGWLAGWLAGWQTVGTIRGVPREMPRRGEIGEKGEGHGILFLPLAHSLTHASSPLAAPREKLKSLAPQSG